MRIAVTGCMLALLVAPSARAAFTDFADLPANAKYNVGQVIVSKGIELSVVGFINLENPAITGGGGSGLRSLNVGPGVSFLLPAGVNEISFDYIDGAALRLAISGVQPATYRGQGGTPHHAGFSFLNGTTLGGVDVSTTTVYSNISSERGVLTLRGPIDSLVIAGSELIIDNVSVVPEPHAAGLLLVGITGLHALRRRAA
jgi:hypothetical protein